MNISPSQCNSGCESGWTSYLDQSSYLSQSQVQKPGGFADYVQTKEEEEEEEEDLSMVSDASSGPPHYHDFDEDCVYENGSSFSVSWGSKLGKKSKKKSKGNGSRELHLDDTASSPVLNYSKKLSTNFSKDESSMQNVLGYSEGFSATHKKGKSALLQHFGFLKSSLAKSPASQKPGESWE
ncbi:protein SOB FIVE-LIKE 5 isoform X2 [Pyrus x bretschneideri]|uniref:protein SOB FIVE-LIKE 5 isoform X2 n=1 Tax=Pyrus x bretschneideri TaxID=225117 RepID=UPI0020301488|nr:protein SOB FIVE-LIKE 5 isoform X2 [Pyrus x bretschneideri]